MSLRDFNTVPPSDDPIALHNEPMGNGAGLSNFHTTHPEEREPSNTPKIVGAVAVALMVSAAAIGFYATSGSSTQPQRVVADNSLPKGQPLPAPSQQAMAPESSMQANSMTATPDAAAPDAASRAPQPAAETQATAKPTHVRTASARPARGGASGASMGASMEATTQARMAAATPTPTTTQAPEPAQVTPVPEQAQATPLPASPAPSPSDMASNNAAPTVGAPQEQSSSIPQTDNAAQAASPAPSPTAPEQQPAAIPAPAQAQ